MNTWALRVLGAMAAVACTCFLAAYAHSAERPPLRVGSEFDFRPYAFVDKQGRPSGFSVDLIRAVAREMGVRAEITSGPWEKVWGELVAGQVDVLPIVARTPNRTQVVDFSVPHTETFDAFFVREGHTLIRELAEAAGKTIVVMRSDAAHHELLDRHFAGELILVDTIPQGLQLVAEGKYDALLCSKLIGTLEMNAHGIQGLTAGPPIPDYKRQFAFAVKKGNSELVERLNQALLIVKSNGEYDLIYRRWLTGEEPWRQWIPYLQWTLAAALVLAASVVLLQWLVRRRTRELALAHSELSAEVAERRKAEAALQQANATLEQRVADRTAALREADQRKDEFLALLAHELRNPLAPVRTGVHVLRMKPDDAKLQSVLPMMERQIAHMARLLDDLLDVSRITRGKVSLSKEPIELAQAIEAALEASRPLIEQMRHQLTVELPAEPIRLEADPVRLAQVFSNLLNNAAKYTERGGRIELRATLAGHEATVIVRDNGIGIPRDQLNSIFELFSQVGGASSRSHAGLGIGLSLVKGLLELHGGSVQARSDGPGCGSEFIVRIPANGIRKPSPVHDSEPGLAPMDMKILVVDDNGDAADSLALLLRMLGNEVRTARTGQEALSIASQFRPGAVLLDLGMPGMDGHEVCRRLRASPEGKAIRIIAVSGWGQDEDRRKSQASGFDAHLVKPVDAALVARTLAQASDRTAAPRQPA